MPTLTASVPTLARCHIRRHLPTDAEAPPCRSHRTSVASPTIGSVEGFELILVLVVVVGAVVTVARRIHVPWPVLLVVAGLALTRVPAFSHVEITPELVLTVFLPPLLFGAAWERPVQDFKRYRRPILLLSVGLVRVHDRRGGVRGRRASSPASRWLRRSRWVRSWHHRMPSRPWPCSVRWRCPSA